MSSSSNMTEPQALDINEWAPDDPRWDDDGDGVLTASELLHLNEWAEDDDEWYDHEAARKIAEEQMAVIQADIRRRNSNLKTERARASSLPVWRMI